MVDDALTLRLFLGLELPTDQRLHTTFCWWWRLATALRGRRGGQLSRPVLTLGEAERALLEAAVERLPEVLAVADPRQVLPVAADLHHRFTLQLLAAEALAVALTIDGEIMVGTDNPNLGDAARRLGVPYQVMVWPR